MRITFLSACPTKLHVSSTRPTPHNGLLSKAARKARGRARLTLAGDLDGSFDQPPIHVPLNEPLAKGHQCAFTERRLFGIETIEHQLPASIHERRLNDLIIRNPSVRF
jgi:hypothetical protein